MNENDLKLIQEAKGKRIAMVAIEGDDLVFRFTDGSGLVVADRGQDCCERRYMTCDDDLNAFVGTELHNIEAREVGDAAIYARKLTDCSDLTVVHEVAFLVVTTSLGAFTVATHNEHNGYYGGFSIRCWVPGWARLPELLPQTEPVVVDPLAKKRQWIRHATRRQLVQFMRKQLEVIRTKAKRVAKETKKALEYGFDKDEFRDSTTDELFEMEQALELLDVAAQKLPSTH